MLSYFSQHKWQIISLIYEYLYSGKNTKCIDMNYLLKLFISHWIKLSTDIFAEATCASKLRFIKNINGLFLRL